MVVEEVVEVVEGMVVVSLDEDVAAEDEDSDDAPSSGSSTSSAEPRLKRFERRRGVDSREWKGMRRSR